MACLRKFPQYRRWIGLKGALSFVFYELIHTRVVQQITIGDAQVVVRTATSDLAVVASCLIQPQYAHIDCNSPSVIVDAGANIGASAIYFASRYPNARVFAIEPEQENFKMLLENTKQYKNIIAIRAALWGEVTTRILRDRRSGPWGYTIAETESETQSMGQQVKCITVSSLMTDYHLECIDLFKMDIEGGEKGVFESSHEWIDRVNINAAELHDRIFMGCDRAFYIATRGFDRVEKKDGLVTAYRKYGAKRNYESPIQVR